MAGVGDPQTERLIGAIDQGTSSSRFLLFSSLTGELVTFHQEELAILVPHEGWAEHDPLQILASVHACVEKAVKNLVSLSISPDMIATIGITNQRESLVVWDKRTGKHLYNAILWLDTRTIDTVKTLIAKTSKKTASAFQKVCGLPLSTYFSAVKLRWLLDNVDCVRQCYEEGQLMVGTVDTWLVYNLTGRAVYATDVTNASRTMLMNIHRLQWDPVMCKFFDIDIKILPEIKSCSELYGVIKTEGPLQGKPITGVIGDQHAALVGQDCCQMGQVKSTYGTGCFMLCHTGDEPVFSQHGLLTTVAYQLGKGKPVHYALEGSIAVAGAAVTWLRDQMKLITNSEDLERKAASVKDTSGCYFVPALTGLLCPYWNPRARGTIVGMSQFTTDCHVARACLEAVCFQVTELLHAMAADQGPEVERRGLSQIRVDGGMVANDLLMQLQADISGIAIERPAMAETTSLGAALAAAHGLSMDTSKMTQATFETFHTQIPRDEGLLRMRHWKASVSACLVWEMDTRLEPPAGVRSNQLLSVLKVGLPSLVAGAVLGILLRGAKKWFTK